ncbi:MAG TPA: excalibur calcium-binding domain-containing protein [Solirubrobacterales bacterium]|nr:excalibur calcium-binding domain-containing protein [Solirubrobacterales bacterium]
MIISKGLLILLTISGTFLLFAPTAAADYDCGDFGSQAEAQEHLLPGDPDGLDADSDGIACESNPCPCSSGSSEESAPSTPSEPSAPMPPPPYRLEKSAARSIAKKLVGEVVRRSPRLEYASFGGCTRLGERRIDCRLSATGRTQSQKITCQYRVSVRARNRHPEGRIVAKRCRTETLLLLTYSRAKAALKPRANEAAGKPTSLEMTRVSRLMFTGYAQWLRLAPSGGTESCGLEMTVELLPSNELRLDPGQTLCEPLL